MPRHDFPFNICSDVVKEERQISPNIANQPLEITFMSLGRKRAVKK
jgi:hypothetical protein